MPGLLSRLLGLAEKPSEARSAYGTPPGYAEAFGIAPSASGVHVNARVAENLATVLACVGAISSTMASLPAYVYRRAPAGREELTAHPVTRLLRRPNPHQTWPDWMEWTMAQVLLHGNAVSAIDHDAAGRVIALRPLAWGTLQLYRLPSGRLAYDVVQDAGGVRRYFAEEVFHLRDRSDDALIGRSRISRAPEVLGNASSLQDWTGNMWRNHATPSGVYSVEGNLTGDQYDLLLAHIENRMTGNANARRPLIVDRNAKWTPLAISPEDAEVLASRRFTVEELCRLFQVPPPIVQDYTHNTFTNAAQASLWFAQLSLAPWARKIEAEFSRSVFGATGADCFLEVDLSGLMRGDYEARWKAHEIAVRNQILDANEVREIEGWNPRATPPTPAPQPGAGGS